MAKKPARKIGASAPKKHRTSERSKANLKPVWKPGESGNPAGRQKGSRNKLSEDVLRDFCALWEASGFDMLLKVAKSDPAMFARLAVSLIPKQLEVDARQAVYVIGDRPLSADEWANKHTDSEVPDRVEPAGRTAKRAR